MAKILASQFVKSAPGRKDFLLDRKQVVFLGRSNAGKSSLVNAVLNNKVAIVSKEPGRTQMVNYYSLGSDYYLADAPGYGFFTDSKLDFGPMMDDYLSLGKKFIKACYVLIDARRGLLPLDEDAIDLCLSKGLIVRLVMTKADKLNTTEKNSLLRLLKSDFPDEKIIITSSSKHVGLDELRGDIMESLNKR